MKLTKNDDIKKHENQRDEELALEQQYSTAASNQAKPTTISASFKGSITKKQLDMLNNVALFTPSKIMKIYHMYDEAQTCFDETTDRLGNIDQLLNWLYEIKQTADKKT